MTIYHSNRRNKKREPVKRRRVIGESPNHKNNKGTHTLLYYVYFISALAIAIVFLGSLIGAYFIKKEIQLRLAERVTVSSSVIYSRSLPIKKGDNLSKIKLFDRLNRLQYRQIETEPLQAGEYFKDDTKLVIYLRGTQINQSYSQAKSLLRIDANNNIILSITDLKEGKGLDSFWLEPEILSTLGNSSERISLKKQFPEFGERLKEAVLATEDEHFYQHFGIDPPSIIRALIANLRAGKVIQGGSTLTQQLAKNLLLSSRKTILRKLKEAAAAIFIETAYTKDQIFEMYLNEIFLGQEGRFAIHGFGEASRTFFNKEVSQLSLSEASLLAGMVKAPSSYSPRRHLKAAKKRQSFVLSRMIESGYISESEKKKALSTKLQIFPARRSQRTSPYFASFLESQISSLLASQEIHEGALKIVSTLDTEYQACAEKAVSTGLAKLEKQFPRLKNGGESLQAALIGVEPSNGAIRSWVGGRDFSHSQFDRISQAKRQPGSTFKPFVYLTALDEKLNNYRTAKTTSILIDEATDIRLPNGDTWSPKNYGNEYVGEVRLREALAKSLNLATVNLAQKVGIEYIAKTGALFGFGTDLPKVPSLALGAGEVTPLELAQAYAILANGGTRAKLRAFDYIQDSVEGETLLQTTPEATRITSPAPVFVLTDILRSAVDYGTGRVVRRMGYQGPAAGKTGTTNDARDAWFAGFTPHHLAIVWVGYDSNKTHNLSGSQAATPLWTEYMKCIEPMEPAIDFIAPSDVVYRVLDRYSGLLLTENCPQELAVTEVFVRGTEPVTPCPNHGTW